MTTDQHMFCKYAILDAREELWCPRKRRQIAQKLAHVLSLLRDRDLLDQLTPGDSGGRGDKGACDDRK
jgi:hypothetical protein